MLLCETAGAGGSDIEDLAVFASQLAALGMPARVAVDSVPENPGRNLQFDLAPHLFDGTLGPGDGLVLLAADQLTDEALPRLRRIADGAEMTVRAFGCFARPETALGVRARLAYIFGRDPVLSDVTPADPSSRSPAPAFGVPRQGLPPWHAGEAPRLLLVGPDSGEPAAGRGAAGARDAPQLPPRDPYQQPEQATLDRRSRTRHPVLRLRRGPSP